MSRFAPGDLVWVNKNEIGMIPIKADATEVGYQEQIPAAGTAGTIIRHALARDFPAWQRRNTYEAGITYAGLAAKTSWLIVIRNELWLFDNGRLNKRVYTPRKS